MPEQTSIVSDTDQLVPNSATVEMSSSSQLLTNELSCQSFTDSISNSTTSSYEHDIERSSQTATENDQNRSINAAICNLCVLCLTEEKRLACIPCGHMATCVACGRSLRSCPICRRKIKTFIRIYT
ncbi:unnamed protein product [Rotaria sp. Silwood1]|nr:unnamed protein product [Rotaria sp. Silwood1]CAF4649445.1 unnamed protein product [Rotaria sp. Silwood1]CAF4845395.1 unnamed protein product [Rotaria sp. Silwood1]CAF5118335.1 unnamed protein product [Rotaria sp. Silwood1]